MSSQVTQPYQNYPSPRGQNHGLHDEYRAYVTPSDMWRAPIIHFRHRDSKLPFNPSLTLPPDHDT
ncbi:hypothetical protein N7453_000970 [Penicillium expansum]|nr:hypothetical protein N7453_000970 [Penicillium expansum]